jgi:hypothetical protein
MLRDGESTKEPDSFFVPPGTVESSPVIHRRGAQRFLPRPVRTLESGANKRPWRDARFIGRSSRQ